jgi:hypothetical protein
MIMADGWPLERLASKDLAQHEAQHNACDACKKSLWNLKTDDGPGGGMADGCQDV